MTTEQTLFTDADTDVIKGLMTKVVSGLVGEIQLLGQTTTFTFNSEHCEHCKVLNNVVCPM